MSQDFQDSARCSFDCPGDQRLIGCRARPELREFALRTHQRALVESMDAPETELGSIRGIERGLMVVGCFP